MKEGPSFSESRPEGGPMQIAALPIPFHRAASNRPPELSQTAAVRLKLLEQWRAIRAEGATATRAADILHVPRAKPLPLGSPPPRARTARPRTRLPPPAQQPQAQARPRPRRGRPRPAEEAALLRQGQDHRRVAQAGLGRLRLHGRAHPLRREEARNPPRAPATRRPPPQPPPQTPLRRPKAQRLPARPPRRPRPKSTPSTFARSPAWSSSISRRGTSSPAATSCRWGRRRPPRAPRDSSTPSLRACPSRSGLSKWTEAPSSMGRSRRRAVSAASCCSSCRRIRRS